MEERKAPPLAAMSVPEGGIAPAQAPAATIDFKWPPSGWPMFSCVTHPDGIAFNAAGRHEDGDFLKYRVRCAPDGLYELEIFSGAAGDAGSSETPVIGMRFAAREDWFDDNPGQAVLDIHIRGQRLIPERGAVLRVILAMTFIISRIDRGLCPSLKRVLKTYRLGQ